jgi:hypothetical protein
MGSTGGLDTGCLMSDHMSKPVSLQESVLPVGYSDVRWK